MKSLMCIQCSYRDTRDSYWLSTTYGFIQTRGYYDNLKTTLYTVIEVIQEPSKDRVFHLKRQCLWHIFIARELVVVHSASHFNITLAYVNKFSIGKRSGCHVDRANAQTAKMHKLLTFWEN